MMGQHCTDVFFVMNTCFFINNYLYFKFCIYRKKMVDSMKSIDGDIVIPQKKPRPALGPQYSNNEDKNISLRHKDEHNLSKKLTIGDDMGDGSPAECTPKHDIMFTKVHKSGSSTLQNILLRYGDLNDLTFVIPPMGHHLGYPNYFDSKKHMLHTEKDVYNIFCHHARFSPDILKVMPPNSIFISILRDPIDVFESAFSYFKMDHRMGVSDDPDAMTKFLAEPMKYVARMTNSVHTRNNMLYDFGIPMGDFNFEGKIRAALDTISKRFSLILIGEYFEESLILLRDLLCWRTEDVVVFRLNTRNDNSVQKVSSTNRERIKQWNKGDVMLYNHFNRTLHEKIDAFGRQRMAEEVHKLNKLMEKYYRTCVESNQAKSQDADFRVWQPTGVQINGFILKESAKHNPVCERMIKPEIQYTEELRQKQFGMNRRKNQKSRFGRRRIQVGMK